MEIYVQWEKPNCPSCKTVPLKQIGSGRVAFEYNELVCGQCGAVWDENKKKPGFLFRVREAIARSSSV